jgi:hypothetical protein
MRWQGNAAPLVPVWFALQGFKGEAEHGVRIVNFRISESRWLDQMIAAFGEHRIIP